MYINWQKTEVRLVGCGRFQATPKRGTEPDFYDLNLWFIQKGSGVISINQSNIHLKMGDMLWFSRQKLPEIEMNADSRPDISVLRFHLVDKTGKRITPPKELLLKRIRGLDLRWVRSSIQRIIECSKGAHELGTGFSGNTRYRAETLLTSVLMEIDHNSYLKRKKSEQISTASPQINKILDLAARISDDPVNLLTVEEMAAETGLSTSHFALLFKQSTTLSPQRFAIVWRIRHACRMLLETSDPIKEIADDLGYNNVYFFSRQFKKITGTSPRKYRLLNQQNG